MIRKCVITLTFAVALLPTLANADQVYTDHSAESRSSSFVAFMTKLIVPSADQSSQRPVAYADNPELIGHRRGSTNTAWIR